MKEITKGKVTVVTLFYNAEKYLEKSMRSVLDQDYPNIEYLLINNLSTDNSLELAKKVASEYPEREVVIHTNEKNLGFCFSMNVAQDMATGEYMTFVDADDFLDQGAISTYYAFAKSKDYDIIFFDNYIDRNGDSKLRQNQVEDGDNVSYIKAMLESQVIMEGTVWTKLYKTEFNRKANQRFNLGKAAWSDLFYNVRLFALTNNIGRLQKSFYHYVSNEDQTTAYWRKNIEKRKRMIEEEVFNLKQAEDFLKEHGIKEQCEPELSIRKAMFRNQILSLGIDRNLIRRWKETFTEIDGILLTLPKQSKIDKIRYRLLLGNHDTLFILFAYLHKCYKRLRNLAKVVLVSLHLFK